MSVFKIDLQFNFQGGFFPEVTFLFSKDDFIHEFSIYFETTTIKNKFLEFHEKLFHFENCDFFNNISYKDGVFIFSSYGNLFSSKLTIPESGHLFDFFEEIASTLRNIPIEKIIEHCNNTIDNYNNILNSLGNSPRLEKINELTNLEFMITRVKIQLALHKNPSLYEKEFALLPKLTYDSEPVFFMTLEEASDMSQKIQVEEYSSGENPYRSVFCIKKRDFGEILPEEN